ncbi:MAG: hypothetical protein LKI53_06705 [Bacteroidales bacterium]|jgi:hypothetical protein|nr:hypothetical protein [Bacteroidales bacterium]
MIMLDCGYYFLTTGYRLENGSALATMTFFNIKAGENKKVELVIRNRKSHLNAIGKINVSNEFLPVENTIKGNV